MEKLTIAGWKPKFRLPRRINTAEISLCPYCGCMTYTMMDYDGNRYCGKCKHRKKKNVKSQM